MAAFAGVTGPWFTPENLPRMEQLFQKLEAEATHIGERAKNHFARKRPRFLDDRIQPVLKGITDPSYPSGNATRGMLCAAVLAELAPQQRSAIMERGRELGWNRVVAGVHYPSDVTTGRVLGTAIARALLDDPKFQQEFLQVKKEFAAAKKK
jgi:acid phosphatase (class A)